MRNKLPVLATILSFCLLFHDKTAAQRIGAGVSGSYNINGMSPGQDNVVQTSSDGSGFLAGININNYFSDNWFIGTGLLFSKQSYQSTIDFIAGTDIDPRNGYTPLHSELITKVKISSVDLPLTINCRLINAKLKLTGGLGFLLNANIQSESNEELHYKDGSIMKLAESPFETNPVDVSFLLTLGCYIPVGKNLDIQLLPNFAYAITAEKAFTEHLYHAGLQAGIMKNF